MVPSRRRWGRWSAADDALTGFDLDRLVAEQEDEDEMARLLYVAATRAADYLILSAGVDDLEKPQGPWMELLATQFELATGKYIGAGGERAAGEGGHRAARLIGQTEGRTARSRVDEGAGEDRAGGCRRRVRRAAVGRADSA